MIDIIEQNGMNNKSADNEPGTIKYKAIIYVWNGFGNQNWDFNLQNCTQAVKPS